MVNGCSWKPCLLEFSWTIIDLSQIPIWWHHKKIRITFWKQLLSHRIGNDLCSENTKFMAIEFIVFFRWRLFSFLNFMKTRPNLTKVISRKAWPWHSTSKNCKITGEILKYKRNRKTRKSINSGKGRLTHSVGTIFSHILPILSYYFHQKNFKGENCIFKKFNFFGQACFLHSGNQVFAYNAFF